MSDKAQETSPRLSQIEYTPEMGERVCEEIADGKSVIAVCKMPGMPSKRAVMYWRRKHPEFETMYRIAQQERAEHYIEEIMTIADDASNDCYTDAEGNKRADTEHINRSRLRVDTRKWVASKMLPKLYGDKIAVGGAEDLPPLQTADVSEHEIARRIAFTLASAAKPAQEKTH